MKLKYLFALPVLAIAMTACDDIEMSDAKPVENPQLGIFSTGDLAISQSGQGTAIGLQNLADNGQMVTLGTVDKLENFPEDYDLAFDVEMSLNADFAKVANVNATVADNQIVTTPGDVEAAIKTFTNDPSTQTVYARFAGYATNSLGTIRLGSPDYYFADFTYEFTPFAPEKVIGTEYNLRYRESANGEWKTMAFAKASNASVYDEGTFSVLFNVANPGFEWTVQPVGTNETWGVDAEESTAISGDLVTEGGVANVINDAGPYMVIIDVLGMTFNVNIALDYVTVPINTGATTSFTEAQWNNFLRLTTNDHKNYTGTVRLYQNWFLSGMPAFDGVYFLAGDTTEYDEETSTTTGNMTKATAIDPEAKLKVATNGLYYVNFNIIDLTYEYTQINQLSLIGGFNDWDLSTALDLTPGSASRITHWTLSGVQMTAGTEYKFCVNHAWTLSYGGSATDIQQNGGNLVIEEDGTYDFELDFSVQPNVLIITKK